MAHVVRRGGGGSCEFREKRPKTRSRLPARRADVAEHPALAGHDPAHGVQGPTIFAARVSDIAGGVARGGGAVPRPGRRDPSDTVGICGADSTARLADVGAGDSRAVRVGRGADGTSGTGVGLGVHAAVQEMEDSRGLGGFGGFFWGEVGVRRQALGGAGRGKPSRRYSGHTAAGTVLTIDAWLASDAWAASGGETLWES